MKKSIFLNNKHLFVLLLFSMSMGINAQLKVGDNPTTISSSAVLDVESTNKGFLPPRVALTGRTDISTIPSPATSLLVYNTATMGTAPNNVVPGYYFFDGTNWKALSTTNSPSYAQFRSNAPQTFNVAGTKMNFPSTIVNVGGFTLTSDNKITLPAGRIYRVDLNLVWAQHASSFARFVIYNSVSGVAISPAAHLESATSMGGYSGSGTISTFVDTTSGSIDIDVRYLAPNGSNTIINDVNFGGTFSTLTIQAVN